MKTIKTIETIKTLVFLFVFGMVWLLAGMAGLAQPSTGDSVSGVVGSAAIVDSNNATRPARQLASSGGSGIVNVEVVPVLGRPLNPGEWLHQEVFERDWFLYNIPEWVPTANGSVSWNQLIYSEVEGSATSTNAVLQQLVIIRSSDGKDSVRIKDFSMKSTETPTGVLSDTYHVGDKSYSPAAFGVKADGTMITGGPSDQLVAQIVLVVQMRLFNGGGTAAGRREVRDWTLRRLEYKISYEVFMAGKEVRGGKASVVVSKPYLDITSTHITLRGDDSEYRYNLWSSDKITGPWSVMTTANPGVTVPINSKVGKARFFRATPQGG